MLRIDFVCLFPEIVQGAISSSMMRRAAEIGAVCFSTVNPRDFCYDRHQKVDDAPFGGEPGMLIKAEPMALALDSIGAGPESRDETVAVIATDPTGEKFSQKTARRFAHFSRLVLVCGHYEGIDGRLVDAYCTHSISVGDYILTNGELPALIVADAVTRLLPGVLGSEASLLADSHSDGLLSAPNYTRPDVWRDRSVPDVLLSGDHAAVARWRRDRALADTKRRRPDLLAQASLDKRDLDVLSS